jgi:hypothetical protein
MGYVSLREDIDEAVRLANLAAEDLKSVNKAANAAEVNRLEKIVEALRKRCSYIVMALEDAKKVSSRIPAEQVNPIYALRTELGKATDRVAHLETVEQRLLVALESAGKIKSRGTKAHGGSKKGGARSKSRPTPKSSKPAKKLGKSGKQSAPPRSKATKHVFVGTVQQSFSHGRKKQVSVEKTVRRMIVKKGGL